MGSRSAASKTVAIIEVVVVLPWDPATGMPCFMRISSASISARGMTGTFAAMAARTSGLVSSTAEETTTTSAPLMFSASWPTAMTPPRDASRSVIGEAFRSDPETP